MDKETLDLAKSALAKRREAAAIRSLKKLEETIRNSPTKAPDRKRDSDAENYSRRIYTAASPVQTGQDWLEDEERAGEVMVKIGLNSRHLPSEWFQRKF